jgi:hypothetical protein
MSNMDYAAMMDTVYDVITAQPTNVHDAVALYMTAKNAFDAFDVNVIGGATHQMLGDAVDRLKKIAIDLRDAGDYS